MVKWNKDLDTVILLEARKKDGIHKVELIENVFSQSDEGKPNKKTIREHINRLIKDNFLMVRYTVVVFATAKGVDYLAEAKAA